MKKQPVVHLLGALALIAALLFTLVGKADAGAYNLDKSGIAIEGYDPVAFFTDNKPVKGDTAFSSTVKGAKYLFASEEHKKLFDKNPSKYEPEFGGWCAYGVAQGSKIKIDVKAFQIVDGRLLMQYSKGVRSKFNKDAKGNLKLADEKWPEVSKK